jgi:hypothetical protein
MKKFYCSCDQKVEIKYACSNGFQWIKHCFTVYDFARNMEAYNQLVEISSNKEIVSQETENQIQKDLMRTFQKIELFASDNMKMKLMRILKALVAYDPCSGYTQGMNFIAAALVLHCEESVTFWLCTGMLEKYEIRDLYSKEFHDMYKHINKFTALLQEYLPNIYEQFQDDGLEVEMYMMEWILCFMCSYIPLNWLVSCFSLINIVKVL